jgi:hypothetical protein
VAVIPNFLLFRFDFGSLVGLADSRPWAEVPSFILQGRGFGGGVELGEGTNSTGHNMKRYYK